MPANVASILGSRVNGLYYDFTSIEFAIAGVGVQANVTEINYSDGMDPGVFRGTSSIPRGRTRGPYDAEGDFTIYIEDFEAIKLALAAMGKGGFMMASFGVGVSYREVSGTLPITDMLEGCRIVRLENSHSEGNDALVVKVQLSVMHILHNGVSGVDLAKVGGLLGNA